MIPPVILQASTSSFTNTDDLCTQLKAALMKEQNDAFHYMMLLV